ncbi:unnamed protein product [Durusdinium trenchii]|uniref:Uncharacterized protein n=1 Tax=Durusdinium trenchii TaxID=1381693 RepID=A0ABP0PVC0_9DINO
MDSPGELAITEEELAELKLIAAERRLQYITTLEAVAGPERFMVDWVDSKMKLLKAHAGANYSTLEIKIPGGTFQFTDQVHHAARLKVVDNTMTEPQAGGRSTISHTVWAACVRGGSTGSRTGSGGPVRALRMLRLHWALSGEPVAHLEAEEVDTRRNCQGKTPLHRAVETGNEEVVRLLLAFRANLEQTTWSGTTPLQLAVQYPNSAVVKLLLEARAEIDKLGSCSMNALHSAVEWGHLETVRILLEAQAQADPGRATRSQKTALHLAVRAERLEMMRLFLEKDVATSNVEMLLALLKSQPGQEDRPKRERLLHWAAEKDYPELVDCLLQSDVTLHGKAAALQYAAWKGHTSVVQMLLEHRADKEQTTMDGRTALHLAVAQGHREVVKLLT